MLVDDVTVPYVGDVCCCCRRATSSVEGLAGRVGDMEEPGGFFVGLGVHLVVVLWLVGGLIIHHSRLK